MHSRSSVGLILVGALAFVASITSARADDPSAASQASVQASARIVDGSAALVGAGSELTLAAVQVAGDSVTLVLQGASTSVTVSLLAAAATTNLLAASVGAVVEAVAVRGGHLLIVAGESVAFIASADARQHHHHRSWP